MGNRRGDSAPEANATRETCGCLELAELGPSAEAWTVDFVLHRTRQESTISGSLDVCLIYRRGRVDSETCGSESVSWWLRVDLNHRRQHYEGRSLTLTYCFN